jgi:hypothetical protein
MSNYFLKLWVTSDLTYQVANLETAETAEFTDIEKVLEFCGVALNRFKSVGWDGYRMVQEKIGENSWWVLPYLG